MKKHLLLYSFLAGLCLLTKSCIKEGDLNLQFPQFDDRSIYDLPFPLMDTRLTMNNLLKGHYIVSDSTGLLKIVYQESYLYGFSDLQVAIPEQTNHSLVWPSVITIPADSIFPGDSMVSSRSFPITLREHPSNPNLRIDTALISAMDIQFEITSSIQNEARVEFRCSNLIDSLGRPFITSVPIERRPEAIQTLNLSNYRIVPNNPSQQLVFDCRVIIYKDPSRVTSSTSTVLIMLHLKDPNGNSNLDVDLIHGFFGREFIDVPTGSIDLPIMDKFTMDFLDVEKAEMKLTVTNGFGLPILVNGEISTLTRNSGNPKQTMPIVNEYLNYPPTPLAPPVVFTKAEPIQDLINDFETPPYQLQYSATLLTNPNNDQTLPNFLSKNSFLRVNMSVEIPMKLNTAGLTISDTVGFAGLPFTDEIEQFTIKANIHNAFPLNATVFLYFLDENRQPIDSLQISDITSAPVDPLSGHVTRPAVSQVEINLNETQLAHLANTRYLKITGVLDTYEQDMVSIYEDSGTEGFLKVMIGCRIKAPGKIIGDIFDLFRN